MFLDAICVHGCTALWAHIYPQGFVDPFQTLGAHSGSSPGALEAAKGGPEALGALGAIEALEARVLSLYLVGCHLLRSGVKLSRDDLQSIVAIPLNHQRRHAHLAIGALRPKVRARKRLEDGATFQRVHYVA